MPQKTCRCGWKYCKHEPTDISVGSAVRIGTRWYHEDCAHKRTGMIALRDYYYENVDKAVVMKQLVNAIKTLIVDKDVDPDFALFALKFALKNDIKVKSPYSMYYLVSNFKIKEAWSRYIRRTEQLGLSQQKSLTAAHDVTEAVKVDHASTGFGSIFTNGGGGFERPV